MRGTASRETWEEYRRRMIRQTERFIEFGLRHPELVIEIPAKPLGQGGFPKKVAEWFWAMVLSPRPSQRMRRFREWFRGRRLGIRWNQTFFMEKDGS
jgi:hypothetical protein